MVEATILEQGDLRIPDMEVVRLEATDGETYISRKFSKVLGASLTLNDDSDLASNAVITQGTSGAQASVALNIVTGTDVACTLVLYGKFGN
jgi:hypothetical protein